jgi:hypothetical protein
LPVTWGESTVHYIDRVGLERYKYAVGDGRAAKLPQTTYDHDGNLVQEEQPKNVRASLLVLGTWGLLVAMQEMAGLSIPFGGSASAASPAPYQGDCFREGSQHFTEVAKLLGMASPESWGGPAAGDYATDKSKLSTLAETMARLDLEMEKLVKDHAERITKTQLGIGVEQDILVPLVLAIVVFLESDPYTLPMAYPTAFKASMYAILAATGLLSWCLGTSIQTMMAVDKLGYGDVLNEAEKIIKSRSSVTIDVPESGGSAASDVAPVSGSVSASSAISGTPPVASSPGSASGLGPQRTPLNASTGEGQRFGVASPQVAATPEQGAPWTPGSPMPSVAQVAQPSGQAANLSGSFASPSNRINPQGQQAAPEEALRAGDSDDTGAGSGTQGAERAPIDAAAARPQQAPAPTPAPAKAP